MIDQTKRQALIEHIKQRQTSNARGWFEDLEASGVWEENDLTKFPNVAQIPNDFRLVAVWWD